jgi:transcriptional regulator with XRE-family HTH domain
MRIGKYKNKVKEYREAIPITQEELAERLRKRGLKATGAYISQIESGLKNVPYGLAVAICEELGLDCYQVTEIFLPQYFTGSLGDEPTGTDS